MIARDAALTACWLPLESCYYRPDEHGIGLDEAQVRRYATLLREQPGRATDPIVVVAERDGRYRITNGRHRWLAAHLAGRVSIAAVVVNAVDTDHGGAPLLSGAPLLNGPSKPIGPVATPLADRRPLLGRQKSPSDPAP